MLVMRGRHSDSETCERGAREDWELPTTHQTPLDRERPPRLLCGDLLIHLGGCPHVAMAALTARGDAAWSHRATLSAHGKEDGWISEQEGRPGCT